MSTRQIRRGSKLVGYYQDIPGGITQLRDDRNKLLGWYDSNSNTTRKVGGGYYATGNCLGDLLSS